MTACLPLMKSVLTPLAKIVLLPFGLSAAMSATDVAIQNNNNNKIQTNNGLGHPSDLALRTTTLIISNEEIEDIVKIVKSLEEPELLIKLVKQLKMKQRNEKIDFFQ